MITIHSSHVALSWRLATVPPQMIQLQIWAARNSHHPFITPFITPKRRSDEVPYIKIHDETTTNIEPSSIPAHDSSWLLSQDSFWFLVIPDDFAWKRDEIPPKIIKGRFWLWRAPRGWHFRAHPPLSKYHNKLIKTILGTIQLFQRTAINK